MYGNIEQLKRCRKTFTKPVHLLVQAFESACSGDQPSYKESALDRANISEDGDGPNDHTTPARTIRTFHPDPHRTFLLWVATPRQLSAYFLHPCPQIKRPFYILELSLLHRTRQHGFYR